MGFLTEYDAMTTEDRIQLQRDEFAAADGVATHIGRINMTAVVDDDWPQVKHEYDRAVVEFVSRAIENRGREWLERLLGSVR